jgi:uncharacterized protein (DUF1697 family)
MSVYISLLRAINVGGSKIISMDTLCELYAGLGFSHVRTYLQSGNVVFASSQENLPGKVTQIEARIEQVCGYHVQVFIRQVQDFQHILTHNPFLNQPGVDTSRLHVAFLYQVPSEAAWDRLVVPQDIPDKLARGSSVIYLYTPNGFSKSKISTSSLEKILATSLTIRNWNTVTALYKIASEI